MEHNRLSRREKNEKRRSVNRLIITFSAIALLLILGLVFVPKLKNQTEQEQVQNNQTETVSSATEQSETTGDEADEQDKDQLGEKDTKEKKDESPTGQADQQQDNITKDTNPTSDNGRTSQTKSKLKHEQTLQNKYDSIKKTKVSSEDPNVIEAYEADWPPIGTSQKEPHEAKYEVDTVDWQEMAQAIELVTPLDDMIVHWIGNDGPDKAVATVSTDKWDEIYRIYLSWVKHEGWKPTRIEQLEWLQIIK